jgi:hypothetical protein
VVTPTGIGQAAAALASAPGDLEACVAEWQRRRDAVARSSGMRDWGERNSDQYIRIVFSNEPIARLAGLRDRVLRALEGDGAKGDRP